MENLVTVQVFYEPTNVLIPRSLLESEGIECFVKDELVAQVYNVASIVGGVKLQVREKDVEKAVQILMDGGFLTKEELEPTGMYKVIGEFLDKFRKK